MNRPTQLVFLGEGYSVGNCVKTKSRKTSNKKDILWQTTKPVSIEETILMAHTQGTVALIRRLPGWLRSIRPVDWDLVHFYT